MTTSNNPNILYIDPITGIYKDIDGSWYLNNGTPINDYDPNTGAYQEDSGIWYTFQGVELLQYNKANGWYQEADDGSWYTSAGVPLDTDANGNPIAPSTTNPKVAIPAKVISKTITTTSSTNSTLLYVGIAVFIVAAVGFFYVYKKMK